MHTRMQQQKNPGWCLGDYRNGVQGSRALVKPEGNRIPVCLLNPRDVEVSVAKGTILAKLEVFQTACYHCNISTA